MRWFQPMTGMILAGSIALGMTATLAKKPATSDELGGRDRYLAHVSTDKSIYRAGETVYVRSVVLHAVTHAPLPADDRNPWGLLQIRGPKGNIVASGGIAITESVSGFGWTVPDGAVGGEYRAIVTYAALGTPPAERRFDIRAYRAPRIKTQITFLRDGYGPGDTVQATLTATRAEGGSPAGAAVTITARVDGEEVYRGGATVDAQGLCAVRFDLPAAITRGEGTLAFAIDDSGVVETATKTIPILLQTVDLKLYPEGGDLVVGLPCRVYFEARTPAQKPADIAGEVLDPDGRPVGSFRTEHEGRGRFTFTPGSTAPHTLRLTEPQGIKATYPLPPARAIGSLIAAPRDAFAAGAPIVLRVISNERGPLKLTVAKREEELCAIRLNGASEAGRATTMDVTANVPGGADGVLAATVWNAAGDPVAERLIYRAPATVVNVAIVPDHERYVPGGNASLRLRTTDADGKPVAAVVGVTVTDDSVLEMLETRDQPPNLPVMVFLENDVAELADAELYLDASNPDAPRAVDLLLGTQGWRRFAVLRVETFLAEYGDAARRALALRLAIPPDRRSEGGAWFRLRRKGDADMRAVGGMPVPEEAVPADALRADGAVAEPPRADMAAAEAPAAPPAPSFVAPLGRLGKLVAERQEGEARDLLEQELVKKEMDDIAYVTVREYAHQARPGRRPGDRVDFAETLYWAAAVKTDARTGEANVSFALNDAVSSFRVSGDAFTPDGAIGAGLVRIESVQPFYIEPKLPLEVTMGDRIRLPIGVVNGTDEDFEQVALSVVADGKIDVGALAPLRVARNARARVLVDLLVGDVSGEQTVVLAASAGAYADRVTRMLRVAPRGFPVELAEGGLLQPDTATAFTLTIPARCVPNSVVSQIIVYPSPMANLTQALERLIREPNGCFEQTSSTTYPLVMAQQYFTTHVGIDPQLVARSKGLLDKGYKRLIGYECKQRGYEWFGGDPGHEALTAYGLLEFNDMAQVYNVDRDMLARTRAWLLKQRDGKGGFKRERRALHTWIADPDCSNAYITWALLQAGEPADALQPEIDQVLKAAVASANSYVVALGANVAATVGRADEAKRLRERLAAKQTAEGAVEGATTSIVGSGGLALQVETTALALLGWMGDPAYAAHVTRGIRWLAGVCEDGRFGSTQSTVLALRAILDYDRLLAKPKVAGSVQLVVDGRLCGSAAVFDENTRGAITLTDIAELLEPGAHKIEFRMAGGCELPCSIAVRCTTEVPDSSAACRVGLTAALSETSVREGDVVEAIVTVTNRAEDEIIPTPIAIVGIPGGLEVRHDQLKELVKQGIVAAYEVRGREVVLYWRDLKAEQAVRVPLSLVAAIPGTYTGPASRAYLYYTDEHKQWANPLTVTVTPL